MRRSLEEDDKNLEERPSKIVAVRPEGEEVSEESDDEVVGRRY